MHSQTELHRERERERAVSRQLHDLFLLHEATKSVQWTDKSLHRSLNFTPKMPYLVSRRIENRTRPPNEAVNGCKTCSREIWTSCLKELVGERSREGQEKKIHELKKQQYRGEKRKKKVVFCFFLLLKQRRQRLLQLEDTGEAFMN